MEKTSHHIRNLLYYNQSETQKTSECIMGKLVPHNNTLHITKIPRKHHLQKSKYHKWKEEHFLFFPETWRGLLIAKSISCHMYYPTNISLLTNNSKNINVVFTDRVHSFLSFIDCRASYVSS